MQKKVIINRGDHDIRVAFLEDSKLVEYHRENLNERSVVGNIYRGTVQDVVPGLQAAFIDVGLGRNMFLHFMDIRPEALVMTAENLDEALDEASQKVLPGRIMLKGRRPRPDIRHGQGEAPVKRGDTIIVQVVKEEISEKAARVTTNITLAGRYLVLLPYPSQAGGVSRRVAMGQDRLKLKKLLHDLKTEKYSFIVRTAGVHAEEEQVKSDVNLLLDQWHGIIEKFRSMNGPGLVFSDHDIIHRLVRDAFSTNIDEVIVDDEEIAEAIRTALATHLPDLANSVIDYDDTVPIFEKYMVEHQLRKALHRKVWLKSGGYLIIDEMEALTAIDVNTGRFTGTKDQEKTSFRTNMEACEAVAQQIRLRDIGGIIVVDFIDMLSQENQNKVTEEFRRQMRYDRAKSSIGRIGDFGLMVLTRKRRHQSLLNQVFDDCPYCQGEGLVLKQNEIWRRLKNDLLVLLEKPGKYAGAVVTVEAKTAEAMKGELAPFVQRFIQEHNFDIVVRSDGNVHREDYQITPIEQPKHAGVHLPAKRFSEDQIYTEPVPFEDVAELMAEEIEEPEEEAVASAADQESEEEGAGGRRTRRGRRGGRRRRGRGGKITEVSETPEAEVTEEQLPPAAKMPDPAATVRPPRPPRPPRIEQPEPAPVVPVSTPPAVPVVPMVAAAPAEKKFRGLQIVAAYGCSQEAPARPVPHKEPPVEVKPAPVPPPNVPKTRAVQVIGYWGGTKPAEAAATTDPAKPEPPKPEPAKEVATAPEAETGRRRRQPRPARQIAAEAPVEPVASKEAVDPATTAAEPAEAAKKKTRPTRRETRKSAEPGPVKETIDPAKAPAAKKAAKAARKKAAAEPAAKAAKKAAKKAAAKAEKPAVKKAAKSPKAAKKAVKKGRK